MRNRTELVTTTLPGSENEEENSDEMDSEEDWKPEKKVSIQHPCFHSNPSLCVRVCVCVD